MGVVYEAVRESLKSRVALKVMHPRFRASAGYLRRFHNEARSAAQLHHTNIVSVFDYGEHDGVCYYAMQYIAGHSLDEIMADVRRLRSHQGQVDAVPVESGPDPNAKGSQTPPHAVRDAAQSEAATDPLMRSVTVGLLTGQFALGTGGAPVGEERPPPDTARIESGNRSAMAPAQNAGVELGPTRPPTVPSTRDEDRNRPDSASGLSSSSLAGQGVDRYHREVARLGAQVADALAHAHQRGVLHRDIKPANLLLDAIGNAWVTDFGLAKFEEGEDLSRSQDLVGTLRYMAPERFRGVSDRRCDIYALGATLYELLTLRQAFDAKDQLQLIHQIENDPPVPPRQLERGIPRDRETIVLKALAKNPADRFETADLMAAELRRFIENRPIRSRPIPVYQRFGRWCKRNPKLAAASITAAALTTILAIVSTVFAWNYREQRNEIRKSMIKITASESGARQARTEARHELFKAHLDRARAGRLSRRMGQRFDSLEALRAAASIGRELKLPPERLDPLRDEAIACMALPDLKQSGRIIRRPPGVINFAFDPTMTRYALRFRDGTIQVRSFADNQEIARFHARGDRDIGVFVFSPDGRYLATVHHPGAALTVWDIERGTAILNDPVPVSWGVAAKFSPGSRRIGVENDDGELVVYDLATAQVTMRQRLPAPPRDLVFRSDGAQIAVTHNEPTKSTCRILESETGGLVRSITLPSMAEHVAWSPDGTTLSTPCQDRKIYLWDAATGVRRATLDGHISYGVWASFHPAGTLLASTGWEGRVWLWDAIVGRPWLSLTGAIEPPGFSQDGRIVLSREDQLITYQVDPALEYRTFAHAFSERTGYHQPSIRRDGRLLAVGTDRGMALWDLARDTELAFLPIGHVWQALFESSGDLLTYTGGSPGVQRWPVQLDPNRGEFHIGPPRQLPLPGGGSIAEDRAGLILAGAHYDHAHVLTPARAFVVKPLDNCRFVAVSPDGKWLATGSHMQNGAQVWRMRDAEQVAQLAIEGSVRVEFSPDGKWLMTKAPPCRLWEVGTWHEARQIGGRGLCFSTYGRQLVVEDADKVLRLAETETGRTVARLQSPDLCDVLNATFSPDGSRLVVTTNDGPAVHVWDLRAIRRNLAEMNLDWDAPAYPETDAASDSAPPLPLKLVVDMGALSAELRPLLEHAKQFQQVGKLGEAIGVLRQAVRVSPDLAEIHSNLAWLLAIAPDRLRDPPAALEHARHAVRLAPDDPQYLKTLGIALYRAGKFAEALPTIEKGPAAGTGQTVGFDLFFLAMDHEHLGHRSEARASFDRAVSWLRRHPNLPAPIATQLAAVRAEAEELLAVDRDELPGNVFAPE